ncbi:zinc finger and BTB domain-containing protein 26-like isoform X1 [Cimex lectularius]|uniref:Uncharacterized protein n=1 Tax=Cimex lectularius TaxID=79782 RepID=A0A8I6RTC6_CIMLE|nr:zinc finger and BTB domain-containing protein 26-like isoform X1 [Cimex lectularius]
MDEDDYHLKWAKHHDAFVSLFDQYFDKEILVDCTLAAEDKFVKVHRIVVMACSPYLQDVLSQYSLDFHPVVYTDLKFSVLQSIVRFCYQGEVTIAHNELEDFIHGANLLQIKGIVAKKDSCSQGKDSYGSAGEDHSAEMADSDFEKTESNHHTDLLRDDGDGQGSDNSEDDSDVSSIEEEDIENLDELPGFVESLPMFGNILFPWTCSRCGEAFSTRGLHDHHRKSCVIHKDLPWKCDQCPSTYKNKKDLTRHKVYCGKDLPRLACQKCGSTYKYGRGLKRHMQYCGKDLKQFKCPDCDKTFKYIRGLRRHQRRCGIMEALAKLAEKGVTPVLIRKKDGHPDGADLTEAPKHLIPQPTVLRKENTAEGDEDDDSGSSCNTCGKKYKYRRSLQRHKKICIRYPGRFAFGVVDENKNDEEENT